MSEARQSVAFFITERCQNRCRFCFEAPGRQGAHDMDPAFIAGKLDQLQREGVRSIDLVGGEPLLHPAFEDLLGACNERGFQVHVTTNGLRLVDGEFARRLFPKLQGLCWSLHAGSEASYTELTGNAGGFARLGRALEAARGIEPRPQLLFNTSLSRIGFEDLDAILELVTPFAPVNWCLTFPFPVGDGGEDYAAVVPRLGDVGARIEELLPRTEERGIHLLFAFFPSCIIGYRLERSADLAEPDHARGYPVDHNLNPQHPQDLFFERRFGVVCQDCALAADGRCEGVAAAYLDAFGEDELRPPARSDG